jgi:glyoxylate/hydroxypyruvate reductase A
MIIYIDTPLKAQEKARLKNHIGEDGECYFKNEMADESSIIEKIKSADIIFGNPKPDLMKNATNAKWIQLYSAGFEYYQGIKLSALITNMQDYYSQPCAETVIAGIMALYRKLDAFSVLKEQKRWIGYSIRRELQLLNNKKVLILGSGNIGKRIAKILDGFSAEYVFFGRTATGAIHSKEELIKKLPWADIVIGCLPGTLETKGLFTNEMIGVMKPTALFCNVGRGNLVADQDFLIEALMNKKIGGAVLDVTFPEPIPDNSLLWNCPNTILSQHSGGGQLTEYDGIVNLFLENFGNYMEGRPLKNEISFNKGY